MNLKKSAILLFAGLALGSCSKEDPPTPNPTKTQAETLGGDSISLSIEGSYAADQAYTLGLQLDASGKPAIHLDETTVKVYCIIRSDKPSNPTTYVTLDWEKVPGQNKLKYSHKQKNIQVASGTNFNDGSNWYIMGIIGGKVDAQSHEVVFPETNSCPPVPAGSVSWLSAPYIFPWTKLTIESEQQISVPTSQAVRFKPQGIVLRHHFENEMYQEWALNNMTVETNAFAQEGTFSVGNDLPTEGALPTWKPKLDGNSKSSYNFRFRDEDNRVLKDFVVPAATPGTRANNFADKQAGQKNMYFLTWGMPIEGVADPDTRIYVAMRTIDPDTKQTIDATFEKKYHVFYSGEPVTSGTRSISSVIRRPKMALEYMAEYNLAAPGVFATSHTYRDASGESKETFFEVMKHDAQSLMPAGYHLPSPREAMGIFGVQEVEADRTSADPASPTIDKSVQAELAGYINNQGTMINSPYNSAYVYDAQNPIVTPEGKEYVVYAIRWGHDGVNSGKEKKDAFKSAWRYRFVPNIVPGSAVPQPGLIITARYLGATSKLTLVDIAKEAWWNADYYSNDYEAERRLPFSGYQFNGKVYLGGVQGVFAVTTTRTRTSSENGDLTFFRAARMGLIHNWNKTLAYAQRDNYRLQYSTFALDDPSTYVNFSELKQDLAPLAFPLRPFMDHNERVRLKPKR